MRPPIVFMFSGQGSQYYGMARELYRRHPPFRSYMDECDEIFTPLIKASLSEVLYQEDKAHAPFDRILHTNPALFCVEYSLARSLIHMGIRPDYLLGYSLGELTASAVSGALSLAEAVQLAVDFAMLLEDGCRAAEMLAIIESVGIMTIWPELFSKCRLTGRNFENNFVVSGLPEDIGRLEAVLNQRGIVARKLPVKYGFHTELMDPIEPGFRQLVDRMSFSRADLPIISAAKAEQLSEVDGNHLWEAFRLPVDFQRTIRWMLEMGDYRFVDAGPSGTLSTFVKYLLPPQSRSMHFETINPFGRNLISIEKLRAGFGIDPDITKASRATQPG
jgi:bacillaene synthase trans-acting acyltransferase